MEHDKRRLRKAIRQTPPDAIPKRGWHTRRAQARSYLGDAGHALLAGGAEITGSVENTLLSRGRGIKRRVGKGSQISEILEK